MQTTIRHMTATEEDAEEHPPKRKRKNQIPGTWFEKDRDQALKSMGMVRRDSKWHGVSAYKECGLATLFIDSPCTRMGFCVLNVCLFARCYPESWIS